MVPIVVGQGDKLVIFSDAWKGALTYLTHEKN